VALEVVVQVRRLVERLFAVGTLEGPLSRVDPRVALQVEGVGERFPALLTAATRKTQYKTSKPVNDNIFLSKESTNWQGTEINM
jgi:hypothetical protein